VIVMLVEALTIAALGTSVPSAPLPDPPPFDFEFIMVGVLNDRQHFASLRFRPYYFSLEQSFFEGRHFVGDVRKLTRNYLVAVVASSQHVRGVEYGLPELFVHLRQLLKIGSQLVVMFKFERIVKCEFLD
jgi:hypothetical protein